MERRRVMAEAKDCGLEAAAEAFGITDPQDTGECCGTRMLLLDVTGGCVVHVHVCYC